MTWIWFNEAKPLKQLLDKGSVVTVRSKDRRTGVAYVRSSLDPHLKKRVLVSRCPGWNSADEKALRSLLSYSGFKTVDEWKEAIERQHGQGKLLVPFLVEVWN